MGRLSDPWQDRIKLNPSQDVSTTPAGWSGATNGSLDSRTTDDGADVEKIGSMGKKRSAPDNPPATWSSGPDNNDYLGKED